MCVGGGVGGYVFIFQYACVCVFMQGSRGEFLGVRLCARQYVCVWERETV